MYETLAGGGDTDTNGCIVGGLLGTLHGEGGIPEQGGWRPSAFENHFDRPGPHCSFQRRVVPLGLIGIGERELAHRFVEIVSYG